MCTHNLSCKRSIMQQFEMQSSNRAFSTSSWRNNSYTHIGRSWNIRHHHHANPRIVVSKEETKFSSLRSQTKFALRVLLAISFLLNKVDKGESQRTNPLGQALPGERVERNLVLSTNVYLQLGNQ